ncbi:MAG: bifunctional 3,4-dihydroxy-2-butanone 4-phosphate synthase/GTP cyclohydrolase II [Ignavibacteria bacterium GWF2_33_9]|nr:MAG: bifunctional 3,4-dihydroxy-2-butanone 4-phosphate synthase/GTP cyclohydrolase II [Ignavibacteria bacterium GWF2_33_9]
MNTIPEVIEDLAMGKSVIIMDDEDRENEGDLIASSELCTAETINFMSTYARGLVCVSITEDRAEELGLEIMVRDNSAFHGTRFTVSVDYAHGTTSGISAFDRAATIRAISNMKTKPEDLLRPGHIFPLIARNGGVLRRAGHTEAVIDLMKLAGLKESGVLCEIMKNDGTMARRDDLYEFAQKHNLKIATIKELISYLYKNTFLVQEVAHAQLPTEFGEFEVKVFQSTIDGTEHTALVKGEFTEDEEILVRVHSECLTGDVFGSLRCDCGPQLHSAMEMVEKAGKGVILYMRQEGRGIGLVNKLKAYKLQEGGMDTVDANIALGFPADPRDYGIGAQILVSLGVKKMKLITNNPMKRVGIESYGLEVIETVPLEIKPNPINIEYLKTKQSKMGHTFRHLGL